MGSHETVEIKWLGNITILTYRWWTKMMVFWMYAVLLKASLTGNLCNLASIATTRQKFKHLRVYNTALLFATRTACETVRWSSVAIQSFSPVLASFFFTLSSSCKHWSDTKLYSS